MMFGSTVMVQLNFCDTFLCVSLCWLCHKSQGLPCSARCIRMASEVLNATFAVLFMHGVDLHLTNVHKCYLLISSRSSASFRQL